jgi:hypothetical protein
MAALDFPSGPTIGTIYPYPAVAGQPQYTWDGEKWTSGTGFGNIYISDSAPAAPVGSLWWESDTGILYVRYYDGSSTQWVAIAGSPTDAVQYNTAQTLSSTQQTTARSNIFAAPFDAMAYSGMQVNGSMEVSQERAIGTGVSTFGSGHVCDGWDYYVGTGGPTVTHVVQASGLGDNALVMVVNTAKPSLAASDLVAHYQLIEGYRVARLTFGFTTAQPITIGFWSAHTRTGVYCGWAHNGDASRSYVFTYTQNVSAVWQYNVVTIPGDTTGTWTSTNSAGLTVGFTAASGTDFHAAAANTWVAGNKSAVAAQVNGVAATSDVHRIRGVVVLPGIEAPSAARSPLIMRPYDQELVMCQRYWKTNATLTGHWFEADATSAMFHVVHSPVMRSAPTITVRVTANTITRPSIGAYNIGPSVIAGYQNDAIGSIIVVNTATAAANVPAMLSYTCLAFDARL